MLLKEGEHHLNVVLNSSADVVVLALARLPACLSQRELPLDRVVERGHITAIRLLLDHGEGAGYTEDVLHRSLMTACKLPKAVRRSSTD